MTTRFDALRQFTKEFKRFAKKYRSLPEDLEEFKRVLEVKPLGTSKHFNVITQTEAVTIVKARLFCKYLKGSSLRIIYGFHSATNHFDLIELYFKGDKENEDRERIKEYLIGGKKLKTDVKND